MNNPYNDLNLRIKNGIKNQNENNYFNRFFKTVTESCEFCDYGYRFNWAGVPIIQIPQDIIALQELIWETKPDLIIETGIAHGGSLILSASLLSQVELCESIVNGTNFNPYDPKRIVVGIDVDIRKHNRDIIEAHPMSTRIKMLEGSSTSAEIINKVKEIAKNYKSIFVCLDSLHTHDHVFNELMAYGDLVTKNSYCVVFDTGIEYVSEGYYPNRPWGKGNNPKTAVDEYLKTHPEFEIDKNIEDKIFLTAAPNGYLKKIK